MAALYLTCCLWLAAPVPVDLRVNVPLLLAPGDATLPLPTPLRLTLRRSAAGPAHVKLIVDAPYELGGPLSRELELPAGQNVTLDVDGLSQPAGSAAEWSFPVLIEAGGERIARYDVTVSKAGPWWLCGPFDGNRAAAHDTVFPPEGAVELDGAWPGKDGRTVGWRPMSAEATNAEGYHDLNRALCPTENCATYAYAVCDSPSARRATIHLGSDDSVKVWHNGTLAFSRNEHRGAEPDQDRFDVDLVAGRNEFLLKVVNDDGGYGFYFTLDDPENTLRWHSGVGRVPLGDAVFRLSAADRSSATFEWRTDSIAPTRLHLIEAADGRTLMNDGRPKEGMVAPLAGAAERLIDVPGGTTRPVVRVDGLQPGRRYLAWADGAVGGARTEKLAFYTAAPEGRMQYIRLRVIVAIFAQAVHESDKDRECPIAVCPPEEIERIRRELAEAVRWYWVNTGCRLFLDLDYVIDGEKFVVPDDEVYGVGYSPGDEARLVEVLRANGKDIGDYDGRVFISYLPVFDPNTGQWSQRPTGGGTIGPEYGPGSCKCAWRCGYNHTWLFCHEFGHGLDALWANSLGPEWIFNHFQPWDQTAHKHGEHWDGNAWLLWWWAGYVTRDDQDWPFRPADQWHRYLQGRFGQVFQTADADDDGLPDSEPRVPVDEARFGSSPAAPDTDGDGLTDPMETMASQWLIDGLGEIFAGRYARLGSDPTNPDTDGDGKLDGADPYPLYPIDGELRRGAPRRFCEMVDEHGQARFDLGWDVDALTIRITSPIQPERLTFMVDADDNGWYLGTDNYQVSINPTAEQPCRVTFQNCGVPDRWPFWQDDALTADDWSFEQTTDARGYCATVRLKRKPECGLQCQPGEPLGVRFGLRWPDSPRWAGQNGYRGPFEPHTFVSLTLMP